MISIRELASNNNDISTTRWAFCNIVRFDIIITAIVVVAAIVGHFVGMPIPKEVIEGIALLIGSITTVIGGSKIMQGFEKKDKQDNGKWKD